MRCATPAGWNGGDQVKVDLSLNGVDYTEQDFLFNFYSIFGSFPKSAPADADDQYIQVRGRGFYKDQKIHCVLNGEILEALEVNDKVIKCPMMPSDWPSDKFEAVPFEMRIDGSKHDMGTIFYYKQVTIDEVTPLLGPNDGRGAIYVIGRDFRDDFENSKLGCRVGNSLQKA
jgi:hypothetical protein